MQFSVAIPTYNGATRLPLVLDRLRQQVNTEDFAWEIIVIDNNSKDHTAEVVQDYQQHWNFPVPLKYYLEKEQGAAFARLRAIQEAQGELIGFLDDDNLPDCDWVAAAYAFGKEHPQAGAYGGQIHGEYEVKPPENFKRIQSFLAIRERGNQAFVYNPNNLDLPPAAAVVIRKQAWLETFPHRPSLTGRIPGSMLQGEDYEPLLYMHRAGWEIWYSPAMHTYHQIPKWRLEKDYLLSLSRGCGLTICALRMMNIEAWQKPIVFFKVLFGSLSRYLWHLFKYWGILKTDAIAACEIEFYWSSLVSPFWFLKTTFISYFTSNPKANQ